MRVASVTVLVLSMLTACKGPDPRPEPPAATAPAPPPAAPAPTAAHLATATATAAPTATATAPVFTGPRSARPTPREWCQGETTRFGWDKDSDDDELGYCEMLVVREWAMVWCTATSRLGIYDRAVPGGGSMANEDEVGVGPRTVSGQAVVVSLRPGTKATPTFIWRPSGHPDWTREKAFTLELPADAASLADRRFDGRPWPITKPREPGLCAGMEEAAHAAEKQAADDKAKKTADEDAKGQPDVEGLAPAPPDEAWAAEREVQVTGSGALGCQTKVKDSWFWMRCEGKVTFSGVEVERGKRATQTKAAVEGGVAKLVTPYVEETDLRARLTYEGGERFLRLRWPKGKRPIQVGTVGDTR